MLIFSNILECFDQCADIEANRTIAKSHCSGFVFFFFCYWRTKLNRIQWWIYIAQLSTKDWKEKCKHLMFFFINFLIKKKSRKTNWGHNLFFKRNDSHLQLWKHYKIQTMQSNPVVRCRPTSEDLTSETSSSKSALFLFFLQQQHLFCHKIPERISILFHRSFLHPSVQNQKNSLQVLISRLLWKQGYYSDCTQGTAILSFSDFSLTYPQACT